MKLLLKHALRALDENIEHFKEQLRTRKDFVSTEEVFYLQDRISDIEKFKTLPETLLEAAQEDPEETEEEPIYDTPEPEEEK